MTTLIDLSGLAYHVTGNLLDWQHSDILYEQGCVFCADSDTSIRKEYVPLYKSYRGLVSYEQTERKNEAKAWLQRAYKRYKCVGVDGLEGDDIIAFNYTTGDTIVTIDKDFLQLPGAQLVDFYSTPWGFERVQRKVAKFNISTPLLFLTYQLIWGDATDTIPRLLLSSDRVTGPWIMNTTCPFNTAVEVLPGQSLRDNLYCATLPTPLYLGLDPVEYIRSKYGV